MAAGMRVYGLTGAVGSGKRTVAAMFRELGIPVVDATRVLSEVTAPGTDGCKEIVQALGDRVLAPGGAIDAGRLRQAVSSDPVNQARLESIVHPRIMKGMHTALAALEAQGQELAIVEASLIQGEGSAGFFSAVIEVRCEPERAVERLARRDGISPAAARRRLEASAAIAGAVEFVIDNSGPREETGRQVAALTERLRGKGVPAGGTLPR